MTPKDEYAFIGDPPMFRPYADEVHVSVTFTWDIPEAQRLVEAWGQYYDDVRLGGPALGDPGNTFIPGFYVKHGVTFTTRGCNNRCPWCLAPIREGKIREIEKFARGYIVQDNNILQASRSHISRVLEMLKKSRYPVSLAGGLEPALVNDWFAEELRSVRVAQVFLSADSRAALNPLRKGVQELKYLGRHRLRCYVLIAYNGEKIAQAEERLEEVWEIGCLPFAQLYQPEDHYIDYSQEWKQLARKWSRPAATVASHKI